MIDSHCHLEQHQIFDHIDEVMQNCKKEGMIAIVTSCAHPKDFDITIELVKKYPNFVYATVGLHPEYVKDISDKEVEKYIEKIKQNKKYFVGIGEIGLDFFHIKEDEWRKKEEEVFIKFLNLTKELDLPVVIHSRDCHETTLKILEQEKIKKVYWHMFGAKDLLKKIIDNGYYIGINGIVLRSKSYQKIARDAPLERILTETDAPWLHPETISTGKWVTNDPTVVKMVAEKIAEIKKIDVKEVEQITDNNAIRVFSLNL